MRGNGLVTLGGIERNDHIMGMDWLQVILGGGQTGSIRRRDRQVTLGGQTCDNGQVTLVGDRQVILERMYKLQ